MFFGRFNFEDPGQQIVTFSWWETAAAHAKVRGGRKREWALVRVRWK